MKKLFLLVSLFYISCSSTAPVCPTCPPTPPPVIIHDSILGQTITITKHDTTTLVKTDTLPILLTQGIVIPMILSPSPTGDDYPQFQAAINYNLQMHVYSLYATAGNFHFSHALIVADTTGGVYHQVAIEIVGICPALNTPQPWTTNFYGLDPKTFIIGIQQGKGCIIKNIWFAGPFKLPESLTMIQVDTLPFAAWDDGICSVNPMSPNAIIVIDFASAKASYDSGEAPYQGLESYCLAGMNQSGSTDIRIEDCSFQDAVADIVVSPAVQENGELIKVSDCSFGYSRSGFCATNAQQKLNEVIRSKVWQPVHTFIDLGTYGAHRGDGVICPLVDGVNIALYIHQLCNGYSFNFSQHFSHVYAEQIYKLGTGGGTGTTHYSDFQIAFQVTQPGTPTPDFFFTGVNTHWTDCELRVYSDPPSKRLILNTPNNIFENGAISAPPVCINDDGVIDSIVSFAPKFEDVTMFYSGHRLNTNNYDSLVLLGYDVPIVVNPDFTGYFIAPYTFGIDSLDLLLTQHVYGDDRPNYISKEYPVGYADHVHGDTVFFQHAGQGLWTGDILPFVKLAKIKT